MIELRSIFRSDVEMSWETFLYLLKLIAGAQKLQYQHELLLCEMLEQLEQGVGFTLFQPDEDGRLDHSYLAALVKFFNFILFQQDEK